LQQAHKHDVSSLPVYCIVFTNSITSDLYMSCMCI